MKDQASGSGRFKPVLGLGALTFFGIAFVGPTAPYTMFGLGSAQSAGHLALVYVIATVAMSFTAVSFGRMANAHPDAGSTYAYASKELHPLVGYFAGWVMVLDYIFLPVISVIIISAGAGALLPEVPRPVWVLTTAVLITALNLRGIEVTTRFSAGYTVVLGVSVVWFVAATVMALGSGVGRGTLLSVEPFYRPEAFELGALRSAFAVAILSFLGFDGVSTLAEDARNPRRDLPRATLFTCFFCGACFILLTYLGQLAWPDTARFASAETAFSEIGRLVGGPALAIAILALVLAQALVAAASSLASASRLLYGMARDGRVPGRIFGYIDPRLETPLYTVLILGALAALVPLFMNLDQAANVVNFGACLGFVAVNLSAFLRAWRAWRAKTAPAHATLVPAFGVLVCVWIWAGLSPEAMGLGALWTLVGIIYLVWSRRGVGIQASA